MSLANRIERLEARLEVAECTCRTGVVCVIADANKSGAELMDECPIHGPRMPSCVVVGRLGDELL